ncbi:MAG: hypothetical protein IKJ65_00885, partial [Clostridia bacterium]|nr:hypothetical protein [Clostridia bacterium]
AMLPDRCGSKHQAPRQGVFFLLLPPLFSLIIAQTPDSFRNQGFVDGLKTQKRFNRFCVLLFAAFLSL